MMEIAGFGFSFQGRPDLIPFLKKMPELDAFWDGTETPGRNRNIHIEVVEGDAPDLSGTIPVFNADGAWHIGKSENDRFFLYQPPGSEGPFWVAAFTLDLTFVRLHLLNKPYNTAFFQYFPGLLRMLIMYGLANGSGLIMHGAGAVHNGEGYLFCGVSGQGKSTIASLLNSDERFRILSDERIVIRRGDDGFLMSGTPWPSDTGIAVNETVGLSGIYFIHHGEENKVAPVSGPDLLKRFMPVATIPWYEKDLIPPLLGISESIIKRVPIFDLWFCPDRTTPEFIAETIEASGG